MRIPLAVLAATLCLNGAVVAAPTPAAKPELPKWQPVEEGWGAWVAVEFTDAAGKYHSLRCHWSECGQKAKPGTVNLYEWKQNGEQIAFEYKDPRTGQKNQAWKTTFTTKLSYYKLKVDKGQWTALDPATGKTFGVHSTPDMTALGSVVIVAAPTAMAADAPGSAGPSNPTPGQPGKTPRKQPAKKPGQQPAKKPAQPGKKPTTAPVAKLVPLTDREKGWLAPTELSIYNAGMNDATAKDADKAQVAAQYRDLIAKSGLPDEEARKGYKALTASPDAAKIDAYLLGLVELTPNEQAALEKIVKGKEPAGYKLVKDNARLDYADETAKLKKDAAGHPAPEESRPAYAVASKYRGMLKAAGVVVTPDPNAPGNGGVVTAPTSPAASTRLSEKELAALTPEEKKAYEAELAAAGKDADKIAAVNKKYRNIAAKRDPDVFSSLDASEKAALCAPFKAGAVQGTVADNKSSSELGGTGTAKDQLNQTADRLATTQGPGPVTAPPATPGSDISPKVKEQCMIFLASQSAPPPAPGGGLTTTVPKPGTDKDPTPAKKGFFDSMSKETSANIKAGVAGAFIGLLFGSFFGPVGMIVGAAIGGGLFFGGNYVANKLP